MAVSRSWDLISVSSQPLSDRYEAGSLRSPKYTSSFMSRSKPYARQRLARIVMRSLIRSS
ncbi:Uncharacterised protein [Mycobacterium tuberculosis]|uniref:Uncharacterized protein n=1 Tax=Mycobacterium tuberculosis TaxID=1773 RepID=A0A916LDC8_MYCTX|nr:Uncharacterised protein [Mycobacterium tuberculosis]